MDRSGDAVLLTPKYKMMGQKRAQMPELHLPIHPFQLGLNLVEPFGATPPVPYELIMLSAPLLRGYACLTDTRLALGVNRYSQPRIANLLPIRERALLELATI